MTSLRSTPTVHALLAAAAVAILACLPLLTDGYYLSLGVNIMLYAVLCYNSEDSVFSWSKQEEEAVMGKLIAAQEKMARAGRLGPVARLMPTTAATNEFLTAARGMGFADKDFAVIFNVLAAMSGVELAK